MTKINDIFGKGLIVVNVGLASMAKSVQDQGVEVIDLDWQPPKNGVPRVRMTQSGINMETANQDCLPTPDAIDNFLVSSLHVDP